MEPPVSTSSPSEPAAPASHEPHHRRPTVLSSWLWFIGKNVLGWALILGSMVIGPIVPGPGGIPLFLLGFGLVTFPGKRRITARVLRGTPVDPHTRTFRRGVAITALLVPGIVLAYLMHKRYIDGAGSAQQALFYGGIYVAAALVSLFGGLHSHRFINWVLRVTARARRKVRPWLRHHGVDLLPPRRRRRVADGGQPTREPDVEILEIREVFRRKLLGAWTCCRPWLRRLLTVGVTMLIFVWMFRPVAEHWDDVRHRVTAVSWTRVLLASAMFALFLFAVRAMSWRRIVRGFGYGLPIAPATRIWSTSELARYLPGVIWQVVGRVYLCKRYGIRGSHCTASQVLELAIFLLANVLVAVASAVYLGIYQLEGAAETWLYCAMALVPVLIFLLHPRVLYRVINTLMRRLGKPPVQEDLGFRALAGLLLWAVVGLLWQSLAIWLLVSEPLGLPLTKWWLVAGAYSLAWIAGFLVILSPGGLGTRELVFMAAMRFALPPKIASQVGDAAALATLLAFLSVLLRLWTIAGELMLVTIAYALDYRGATSRGARAADGEPSGDTPDETSPAGRLSASHEPA